MGSAENKQLVFVGLGNPGKEYEMTRHNIGQLLVNVFAHEQGWLLKDDKRCKANVCKGCDHGVAVHLLLPKTYMNDSGSAVRRYLDFYKLTADSLVVVTDDVDLPFGHLRIRENGSAGGHNGLKSIETHIGTRNYCRLRIGVGTSRPFVELSDHVLGRFSAEEQERLASVVDTGCCVLRRLIHEPVDAVMNAVNQKVKKELKDLPKEGMEN